MGERERERDVATPMREHTFYEVEAGNLTRKKIENDDEVCEVKESIL